MNKPLQTHHLGGEDSHGSGETIPITVLTLMHEWLEGAKTYAEVHMFTMRITLKDDRAVTSSGCENEYESFIVAGD
jgi:hypothetical protein